MYKMALFEKIGSSSGVLTFRTKPILVWDLIQRRTKAPDVVSFVAPPTLTIPT